MTEKEWKPFPEKEWDELMNTFREYGKYFKGVPREEAAAALGVPVDSLPSGVYSFSLTEPTGFPEVPTDKVFTPTDENLLAKLRSIRGQFVLAGSPVYYHEYLR